MRIVGLIVAMTIVACPVHAEEAPVPAEAGEPDVTPVLKATLAPFTGLLVPEQRFTRLLEAELKLESALQKLAAQTKFTESLEEMYKKKLEQAATESEWYETPTFNRWLGFAIGLVVAGLAVWGGVEVVRALGHGT